MARSKTVISMIGAAAVVAGGWFWLTQQHVLALSLWLLGVAIIVMRKRMRPR